MREAVSLDLDGPVIKRGLPVQAAAFKRALYGINIYNPPLEIPKVERVISDQPLSLFEMISLMIQGGRRLVPGVVDLLQELHGQFDFYGNTGRPNERLWIEITEETLGEILSLFNGIYFTPRGTTGSSSKGEAIGELRKKYHKVMHVDDDPLTALPLARYFPEVNFFLVKDWTTRALLSGVNLERDYPNIRRVRTLREAFSGGINR